MNKALKILVYGLGGATWFGLVYILSIQLIFGIFDVSEFSGDDFEAVVGVAELIQALLIVAVLVVIVIIYFRKKKKIENTARTEAKQPTYLTKILLPMFAIGFWGFAFAVISFFVLAAFLSIIPGGS